MDSLLYSNFLVYEFHLFEFVHVNLQLWSFHSVDMSLLHSRSWLRDKLQTFVQFPRSGDLLRGRSTVDAGVLDFAGSDSEILIIYSWSHSMIEIVK